MNTKLQVQQDKEDAKRAHQSRQTSSRYKSALKELSAIEREMGALLEIRGGNHSHSILPYRKRTKSEATVVVCASDWHVEEEVRKSKVSGLNQYNLDIAKFRAHQFFLRAIKLTKKEQQDIPIKEMVLFLGGD